MVAMILNLIVVVLLSYVKLTDPIMSHRYLMVMEDLKQQLISEIM
jgi:hypothetical protein